MNTCKIDRRRFLKALGFGAASLVASDAAGLAGMAGAATGGKPNIIFIMVDDLGKEWVNCYGGEEMETPHIDALAAGGMRFENAYSMPQCTPTRVTLLTGQYPWRHGWVNHWDVPRWGAGCHFDWRRNASFGRVMKSAGYVTAAAGKWQINDFRVTPDAMVKHGFDEYCMWTGYETGNRASAERYWDPYIHTKEGSRTCKGQFGEDVFCDFLIDFMKRNKSKPMLLYYPMCLTHGPLTTTPLEREVKGKNDMFKAMVRYTDLILGKIVKALDDLKIRDNTIVIWTTDNGTGGGISAQMMGRTVRGGKGKVSENGICEPFIVNCPGLVPSGAVTDALTDFSDMLPTFAELGGAKLPKGKVVDGRSIASLILGRAKDSDREWIMALGSQSARLNEAGRVVGANKYKERAIRDKRYKLVVRTDPKSQEFYDLKRDPGEADNLIDSADKGLVAARKKLEAVIAGQPQKDAVPIYDAMPAQPWDRKPARSIKKEKKGGK